jgi:putative methionine-R-sulfoxide reductase with GAF domain
MASSGGRDDQAAADQLARIQSIADSALTSLDVDSLLDELLARVVDLLGADTAAVLVLDPDAGDLVATRARGLEEEVRQGVRVPLGTGFAGRIAAERRPVMLDHVDETTVFNPILWEKGIEAMLGVPLLSANRLVGVLHVGSLSPRVFTTDDVQLLQVAAERIAGALQTRLGATDRVAAGALQRSLLPGALPRHEHFEFAARYIAAEHGVGGDWYDVFVLPSGVVWAVSGDVAGHGLRAAVVMGRLRSTMRAYALEGYPPEEVLALTDRKLDHFEAQEMATMACAVFEPPFDHALVASAGHLPPVLARPGEDAELIELDVSPPIGTGLVHQPTATKVPMPEGALLFLYTDGLVERRGETLDVGLHHLCETITAAAPNAVCHRAMSTFIDEHTDDDIAILAIRRTPQSDG